MIPTGFDEENLVLDSPPGASPEDCTPLSVWRGRIGFPNGPVGVISCWKPTRDELAEIVRTGRVWVYVWGVTMPPILPTGFNPFDKEKK